MEAPTSCSPGFSREASCLSLSPAPLCRVLRRTQGWRRAVSQELHADPTLSLFHARRGHMHTHAVFEGGARASFFSSGTLNWRGRDELVTLTENGTSPSLFQQEGQWGRYRTLRLCFRIFKAPPHKSSRGSQQLGGRWMGRRYYPCLRSGGREAHRGETIFPSSPSPLTAETRLESQVLHLTRFLLLLLLRKKTKSKQTTKPLPVPPAPEETDRPHRCSQNSPRRPHQDPCCWAGDPTVITDSITKRKNSPLATF